MKSILKIQVQLYSILREKLSPDAKGQAVLQMDDGARLQDLLDEFDIKRRVVISVNGEHETDLSRQLRNGDQVKLFSSISGGAFTAERDKGVNHGLRL